jgi:hypothetical protein
MSLGLFSPEAGLKLLLLSVIPGLANYPPSYDQKHLVSPLGLTQNDDPRLSSTMTILPSPSRAHWPVASFSFCHFSSAS